MEVDPNFIPSTEPPTIDDITTDNPIIVSTNRDTTSVPTTISTTIPTTTTLTDSTPTVDSTQSISEAHTIHPQSTISSFDHSEATTGQVSSKLEFTTDTVSLNCVNDDQIKTTKLAIH